MPERARTDLWEPQGSNPLGPPGLELQQFDHQIAAIALALGQCTMVSEDSDLSSVPGLSVENWAVQKTD